MHPAHRVARLPTPKAKAALSAGSTPPLSATSTQWDGSRVAVSSRRKLMKAMVGTQYGSPDVLQVQEVAKPTPQDNEVLVKVHAVSVNAADLHSLSGKPFLMRLMGFGLLEPKNKILGAAIAGRIEAIGTNVKQFQPGDEVFGDISGCGWGGFAEYVCANEEALV